MLMLPWGLALVHGAQPTITLSRLLGLLIVTAATMALGGFVAFLVGDATSARHALAYGLGWQGVLGGLLQGARAEQAEAAA